MSAWESKAAGPVWTSRDGEDGPKENLGLFTPLMQMAGTTNRSKDSGTLRNVLPLRHFNSVPNESRPQIQPSILQVLQGINPEGLTVRRDAHAHLDYDHREILLFCQNIPRFNGQNSDQHQQKGQPLVGVEDISSENSCNYDLLHPSINQTVTTVLTRMTSIIRVAKNRGLYCLTSSPSS
ncbi:unnamed protein product [Pleuronectes platessa]|uniref:Uncharacterized protein n=1 Tax=Pleuronectes platessa TaxID=8262 RepID=A0A9N7VVR5_PLEPL|nr:unnamed protein product [Pleuronectes platessa]